MTLNGVRGQYCEADRDKKSLTFIRFSWNCPNNVPEFVCIIPAVNCSNDIDLKHLKKLATRDYATGFDFPFANCCSVENQIFYIYAVTQGQTIDKSILNDERYRCSVVVGSADIQYELQSIEINNEMSKWEVVVNSSAIISEGILGYAYTWRDKNFVIAIPGVVKNEKTRYLPFYLPNGVVPKIQPMSGHNPSLTITHIANKKSVKKRLEQLIWRIFQ